MIVLVVSSCRPACDDDDDDVIPLTISTCQFMPLSQKMEKNTNEIKLGGNLNLGNSQHPHLLLSCGWTLKVVVDNWCGRSWDHLKFFMDTYIIRYFSYASIAAAAVVVEAAVAALEG